MQALNEDTVRAVRAQGTRYDGLSSRGSQGRLPGRRKPLVLPLTEIRYCSVVHVCQNGSSEVEEASLSHLPVCIGAGY